jgi:8-oxo-dGTP pyrophosphatase MutT (NUDIX family)
MIDAFLKELKESLQGELPGVKAHQYVMSDRLPIQDLSNKLESARLSAVLIYLYLNEDRLHTTFIKRPTYKGVHSGQISLPGGKKEQDDLSLMHTAYREAEEEISIDTTEIEALGELSRLYIPPSNFLVSPYVAFQKTKPILRADKREVEQIIEVPLSVLLKRFNYEEALVNIGGVKRRVKGFYLEENLVWGATAMIIREFLEVVQKLKATNDLK